MATEADKRTDFLWIVQMIMLNYRDGMTGWSGTAGDAVAASHRIPEGMTARDAALDFCGFVIEEFRGAGNHRACPPWLAHLSDPNYP